jgi:hypothetical protein
MAAHDSSHGGPAPGEPSPDDDPFGPPAIPTLVHCIHCGEEYDSYRITWRLETDGDGSVHGFWCCPTPRCGGMGFGFDIFPVDPEYRDENGELMWTSDDVDEDDAEYDEADEFETGSVFELGSADSWESDVEDFVPGDEASAPAEDRDDDLPW